jgi:hypothetical protein
MEPPYTLPEIPHTVMQCIDWWTRKHKYLQHPDRASGECGVETWNLMAFVREKAGVDLEEIWGDGPIIVDVLPLQYDQHTLCCFDGAWAIDATARQFWRDSPFPLIERLDVYSRRFNLIIAEDEQGNDMDLVQDFHMRFPNLRQPDRVH